SMRATFLGAPKSISSQSLSFGDSKQVQRLWGVGLKLTTPSLANSTLSKRDVKDADAFGNAWPPLLRARLPAGGGAEATGKAASPQTSNSVRPVRPVVPCLKTARTLLVCNSGRRITCARRPVGSLGLRICFGTRVQVFPSQYSKSNRLGGVTCL